MFAWFVFLMLTLAFVWLVRSPRLNTSERAAYISLAALGLAAILLTLMGAIRG